MDDNTTHGIASDPVTVQGAVRVDFNDTGSAMNGTLSFPYRTLGQGLAQVRPQGRSF